ncbi:clasp N-terminal domain-containing protein [Collybia nuda]|uniref:Clasp N-terminal domain-containing protein n=1 Tax=Collybia nuda TaxID=64659 RepID=A0A9P6CDR9_9AGAR|nr:clasp N-terminal domain-containing protein [Collybia nuda]
MSLLKREIDKFNHVLSVPETEDTWESLSKGIQFFTVICKNGACDWPEELVPALRLLALPLIGAMSSERTRLSGVAIDLIASVASGLGCIFEPLLQIFFPVLLTLSGRTNKVIVTRARACISVIIETTQLPSILPYFLQSMKDKSTSLRLTAAEGTLTCMNCFNPPDLEKDTRAREVESVIRATARDANADIRKVSRKIFDAYKLLLPDRVDRYV